MEVIEKINNLLLVEISEKMSRISLFQSWDINSFRYSYKYSNSNFLGRMNWFHDNSTDGKSENTLWSSEFAVSVVVCYGRPRSFPQTFDERGVLFFMLFYIRTIITEIRIGRLNNIFHSRANCMMKIRPVDTCLIHLD